jgi:dTDP-4-dehydrorhamnose reductase
MRILILGATGMLGHKLWQRLRARFPDTYATMRAARADFAYCGLFDSPNVIDRVDAMSVCALERVLADTGPGTIINCIAVTRRREAATDALTSIELNAALPHRLAAWAASRNARVIHFSTDCVFDGRTGGYTEASATNAEDLYGRTKALGEISGPGSLTLRTSFIGRELNRGTELLEWFLAQRGGRIKGYRNALYTGVSTLWMANLVGDILERHTSLSGVFQVAAPVISKFDLLGLARKAYNLPVEIDADDAVVVRRHLDGARFRQTTGIDVPDWSRMMADLAADSTPYDRWRTTDAA